MASAREYLEGERQRYLNEAKAVTDTAEAEGRPLAAEDKEKIGSLLKAAEDLKVKIQDMEEQEDLRKQIEAQVGSFNKKPEQVTEATSLGDAFVKSDAYKALVSEGMKSGRWTTGAIEIPFKVAPADTLTTVNSPIVYEDNRPGIQPNLFQPLTIASLMASGSTDSNMVRYIVEDPFGESSGASDNNAGPVQETGEKPSSALRFGIVDEPVIKVATHLPVSDEMIEDVAQMRSYLDGRLRLFVQIAEEDQLLNGAGPGGGALEGLLEREIQSDDQDSLAGTAVDALYQAMTAIRSGAFVEPDAIVINPTDWASIRLAKDSNEQYYGGGPFTGAYGNGGIAPNNLWGLPVVVTSAITQGSALVGAFGTQAQIFRKGGLTVEASNSHSDFFVRNLTAIRAEERLALAVYRPAAFFLVENLEFESA